MSKTTITNATVGSVSNSVAISGIVITNSTVTGNVTNTGTGTITAAGNGSGINISSGSVNGTVVNNGTITAASGTAVLASNVTISDGISNNGTISAADGGISVRLGVHGTFGGGITNSKEISAGIGVDIATVGALPTFSGGVTNTGAIKVTSIGILLSELGTFAGGIVTAVGQFQGGFPEFLCRTCRLFLGGITNTGTISSKNVRASVSTLDAAGGLEHWRRFPFRPAPASS